MRCTGGDVMVCTGDDGMAATATGVGDCNPGGLCTGLLMACAAAWRMLGLALPASGDADGWTTTGDGDTAIGEAAARPGRVLMIGCCNSGSPLVSPAGS